MEEYIKKHMDELYKTGMTTFRDINGEYDDNIVEFKDLVRSWALTNNYLVVEHIREGTGLKPYFLLYAHNEIKQLCIDYYGDE